jgi:hypothetical protein
MLIDAPAEHYPYHQGPDELVVTQGDRVVGRLPCAHVPLDGGGLWDSQHVAASLGRTSDGTLHAVVRGGSGSLLFHSADDGRAWTGRPVTVGDRAQIGAFAVLADDRFVAAAADDDNGRILFFGSRDRGRAWEPRGLLRCAPFDRLHLDGNLLQLRDGTLLLPVQWVRWAEGSPLPFSVCVQYMVRSRDGGATWQGGPDRHFWGAVLDNHLTISGTSPAARLPGAGGTFPGVWETGIAELADGTVLAAFRYSGPPQPWHQGMVGAWNGAPQPDAHGRLFRIILRGHSTDQGLTWGDLGPIAAAGGGALLIHGECNGELVPLPDGRVVLVHQRRYPRSQSQIIARVSADGGRSWGRDEYRLSAGFGYPSSLALADGTLVTVVGRTLAGPAGGDPVEGFGAVAIRWRIPTGLR